MDWDKLRIFHAVAEAGSFTHAGEHLNLSQSAVSRQIGALEESLGTPLFHRHARGLALTEQGEILHRTVRDVFAKLAITEAMLSEGREQPSGPLRVTTTVAFGSTWLTPRLREFLDLYPDISVSLVVDDSEVELGMGRADVAIRMVPPRQADLIQRRLLTVHSHVYAASEYLQRQGVPTRPEELDHHHLIGYLDEMQHLPPATMNWLLEAGGPNRPRKPILRVNNLYAMYRAAQNGVGLAALPDYMVHDKTGLVRVLPELEGPALDTYFVYPEELRNSKRIAVFRDFLVRKVAEWQF